VPVPRIGSAPGAWTEGSERKCERNVMQINCSFHGRVRGSLSSGLDAT
jgi:hypothetical protein